MELGGASPSRPQGGITTRSVSRRWYPSTKAIAPTAHCRAASSEGRSRTTKKATLKVVKLMIDLIDARLMIASFLLRKRDDGFYTFTRRRPRGSNTLKPHYPRLGCSGPRLGRHPPRLGRPAPRLGQMIPRRGCPGPRLGRSGPCLGRTVPLRGPPGPRLGRTFPGRGSSGPSEGRSAPSGGQSRDSGRQSSDPFRQSALLGERHGAFQGRRAGELEEGSRRQGAPGEGLGGSGGLLGRPGLKERAAYSRSSACAAFQSSRYFSRT